MKKILLLSAIVGSICISSKTNAQVSVNVNLGGGGYGQSSYYSNQPYYNDQDYYYMPEVGAYYNVARSLYFFQEAGRWISGACLPARFNGYTYNRGMNYRIHDRMPFMHDDRYRARYANNYNDRRGFENRGGGYDQRNNGYNNGGYNNGRGNHEGGSTSGGGTYNNGQQNGGNYNNSNRNNNNNGGGHNFFNGNGQRRW